MSAELDLLLRLHDGDDRCGCLRAAMLALAEGDDQESVIDTVRCCLETHPSGSTYYRRT